MILSIDTSSAACSAALFDPAGACVESRNETIGRGHSERLVPMLDELLQGRQANSVIVGVGPGSFTGIRVGIAAAQGLAIAWNCDLKGMSSLALLASSIENGGEVAVAVDGGHGELFVQQFNRLTLKPLTDLICLPPREAAARVTAPLVVGPGARALVDARGWGTQIGRLPSAEYALQLPSSLRSLAARPIYARAPDAKPRVAA